MKPLEYRFSLNMNDETAQVFCNVRNGDDCSKLIVSLQEDGRAYTFDDDVHAYFLAKKSDGNSLYTECSVENNTIIYEFTEQTAPVSGTVVCQFLLLSSSNRLTTPIFRLEVFDNVSIDPDSPQSLPEYTALIDATQDAIDATDDMRDLIEEIEYKLEHGEFKGDKGDKGDQGNPGADGFSPTATITKSGHTATITITDKNGTTTVPIYDGNASNKMDLAPLDPTYEQIAAMPNGQLYSDTINHKGIIKGGQEFYDTQKIDELIAEKQNEIRYERPQRYYSDSNDCPPYGTLFYYNCMLYRQTNGNTKYPQYERLGCRFKVGQYSPPTSSDTGGNVTWGVPAYNVGDIYVVPRSPSSDGYDEYIKDGSFYRCESVCRYPTTTVIRGVSYYYEWKRIDTYNKTEIDSMIPTVPTNISAFTNDSGYLTLETLPIYDGTVI